MVLNDLVEEDDVMLSASFSATEIRLVMATTNGNKTRGPNGFNFFIFLSGSGI
jgi:hypothetical protein